MLSDELRVVLGRRSISGMAGTEVGRASDAMTNARERATLESLAELQIEWTVNWEVDGIVVDDRQKIDSVLKLSFDVRPARSAAEPRN